MADTSVQREAEDWVRIHWLPKILGQKLYRERLKLNKGRGDFDFDAVSEDRNIAACISTSAAATAGGKHGVGKMMKLRADMLWLLMCDAPKKYLVLTDRSMYDACCRERETGRTPASVEFLHAELPTELQVRIEHSRKVASDEVSPRRDGNK